MPAENWRDTLYVWDGILTVNEADKTNDGKVPVSWIGTSVECADSPDATMVKAPTRGAFAEFVDSDMQFSVSGTAEKIEPGGNGPYRASLVNGEGWDSLAGYKRKKEKDTVHDVFLANLNWSGNVMCQTDNLVFAKGKNVLGRFISVGWMRPGNRVTLGRRYLRDDDARATWDMDQLIKGVLGGILLDDEDIRIPPWQCPALDSEQMKSPTRRRRVLERWNLRI
jgi:hypothetical protein